MAVPPQAGPTGAPGGEKAGASSRIETLKKRSEFLATRKGARWATPHFVLEALKRAPQPSATQSSARFGFTVSKKVGGAVERNRIKRRLKAAVAQTQGQHARAGLDYVLIARRPALAAPFASLLADLVTALGRVSSGKPQGARGARSGAKA